MRSDRAGTVSIQQLSEAARASPELDGVVTMFHGIPPWPIVTKVKPP